MDDAVFISQAMSRICGSLNPQTVLKNCFEFLRNFMPMESITMTVFDHETQSLNNIAYYYESVAGPQAPPHYWQKAIKLPRAARDYIMSDTAYHCVIVNDAKKDPSGKLICREIGINDLSYMVLRIPIGSDVRGQIIIGSRGLNLYSPEHGRLLELLKDPFSIAMTNAIQHQEVIRLKDLLSEDNRYLYKALLYQSGDTIIGEYRGLKDVMETIRHIAKLKSLVMLLGETGVGKEVIANAIHYNSPQHNGPFIKINCGAIPESLIDSELFGHEKGAFTGAVSIKRGHFERAHNGTLFLDEIGDLPLSVQVRLLRVLQQKEIYRVGGTQPIPVNARIIVATHHNLDEKVQKGEFRQDLWFRINVLPITIPPLRQRKEDIPELVEYFIGRKVQEMNIRHRPIVSPQALKRLQSYDWPGNVRELENCVERALIRHIVLQQDNMLDFREIDEATREFGIKKLSLETESGSPMAIDDITKQHLQKVLRLTRGKIHGVDGAAAMLKMNSSTLRFKLNKLGIPFGRKMKNNNSPTNRHPL